MATPKPKAPVLKAVSANDKMVANASKKLEAERNAYAKKNGGNWPTDKQLMNSRKGK